MADEHTDNSSHSEHPEEIAAPQRVPAGQMPPWTVDTLPLPPVGRFSLRRILGPGLLMVGLAIGGGEWLTGPALTAQYGGTLMWIAAISILLQSAYNLEVMRYALYCGEPIMVGFFRLRPGPRFWTWVYMVIDVGAIWPYLSANAAVPLAAAFLGHLPAALPTTYLSVQEVMVETGLSQSVVQEMSEHPERFGRLQEVARNTGLPEELLQQLQLRPERFGNTQSWRPFPHPLTKWVEGESIESVVQRTGLPREVVEQIHASPELFGPTQEVARKTGLPIDLVREMAEYPERYRTSFRWKPIPQVVLDRWISPERSTLRWLAYVIFISAVLPLIFGGKIYNIVERIMAAKTILVLGYLTFVGVFYVKWEVWIEIFSGFFRFGALPAVDGQSISWSQVFKGAFGIGGQDPVLDVALLATFAAIAGSGGLGNATFSNYVRDKGWGMGQRVGAIASAVGGKRIALSHQGKVFRLTPETKKHWQGWRRVTIYDQLTVWVVGCILAMGIPALLSLQFAAGRRVQGDSLAALTAQGIVDQTGAPIFWFLTLLCGFMVLAPSQITGFDAFCRRWTDVIWSASRRLQHLGEEKVKYVYYSLMTAYGIFGLTTLTLLPDPIMLVRIVGIPLNFALGLTAIHTCVVNCTLLPKELRPGWFMRLCLIVGAVFFIGIACVATAGVLRDLGVLGG